MFAVRDDRVEQLLRVQARELASCRIVAHERRLAALRAKRSDLLEERASTKEMDPSSGSHVHPLGDRSLDGGELGACRLRRALELQSIGVADGRRLSPKHLVLVPERANRANR